MPREQINHTVIPVDMGPEHEPLSQPFVHVAWGADIGGDNVVQIAFECDPRQVDAIRDIRQPHDAADWMWSPPLTRTEINLAIRTLRRARDRAFGADE